MAGTRALMLGTSRLGLETEEGLKVNGVGQGWGVVKKVERRFRLWRFVDKPILCIHLTSNDSKRTIPMSDNVVFGNKSYRRNGHLPVGKRRLPRIR